MNKWVCTVCGYIYDPSEGDPDKGVEPGTPFEKIPSEWKCHEYGAAKMDFKELKQ
jgi:rubredoxin